ncbi:MAG: hypothetical protein IIA75_04295 [Proteobacteria bacterium]|nr:hypothetical protein [Pseudomonadota bacterium]
MMNHNVNLLSEAIPLQQLTLLFILVSALCGCQTGTVPLEDLNASIPPVEVDPRIFPLLAKAEEAFAENRLTTPLDDNAYLRYLQVLSIEPDNSKANQGIADIAEKYLAWSIENVQRARYRRARDFLNKARSVDENHPNIATVENMVNSYAEGKTQTFELSRASTERRDPETVSTLGEIAAEISKLQATIMIEAPSDATGRWIYQQLNEATRERVRARFEMTSRVRIHLYY